MKVTAYKVDCCGAIKYEEEIVGIHAVEDMFNKELSYPSDMKHPERCDIHFCLDCYREKVLRPAGIQVDRRKDEDLYKLKLKELGFAFRDSVVRAWRAKQRNLG